MENIARCYDNYDPDVGDGAEVLMLDRIPVQIGRTTDKFNVGEFRA